MRRRLPIRALLVVLLLSAAPMLSAAADGSWVLAPELPVYGSASGRVLLDDAARHRLLLVGGTIYGRYRGVVWSRPENSPGRWVALPSENAPGELGSTFTILDAARDRLVIWDGPNSRLWTVSLGDTLVWSSRVIAQGPNLASPAMAFDAAHRRMLLWSGYSSGPQHESSDLFALPLDDEAAVWSVLPTLGPGPTPRTDAAAIIDATNDRMIVHGGRDFFLTVPHQARGDVWALRLTQPMQWTPLFTADSARDSWYIGHAAVLDTKRQRMLVLGGASDVYDAPNHAEVKAFALDGSNVWSIAVPADPDRGGVGSGVAALYDTVTDAVFEYGPAEGPAGLVTGRLALSGSPTWSTLEPNQARPPARFGQATAYDPVRKRWLSFGGRFTYYGYYDYPTTTFDDVWSFALRDRPEWDQLALAGGPPPARQDGQLLYDPGGDRMILFGGQVTTGVGQQYPLGRRGTPRFYGDTWSLTLSDVPAWAPITSDTPSPGPRDGHVMVLDARRHRMLVFGGRDSLGAKGDLWSLSLEGAPRWSQLETAGTPPAARWQAIGCYDAIADRLVIAGGRDADGGRSDAFELALSGPTPTWSELPAAGTSPEVESEARPYVFDEARRRLLVFGEGSDDVVSWGPPIKVWQLTLDGAAAWNALTLDGTGPVDGYGWAAAMDPGGDRVAIIGGANGYVGEYPRDEHWLLSFPDAPSLVSAALLSMEASPHRIGLVWLSPSAAWNGAHVERREPTGDWRELGPAGVEHGDRLTFTDAGVVPGIRYAYRLHTTLNGSDRWTTVTSVSVPVEPRLVLGVPQPNPASSGSVFSFTLPRAGRSELAVFDIAGRQRELHVTDAAGPGRFELRVAQALEPGLYVIRLTQGAETRVARLCVVR